MVLWPNQGMRQCLPYLLAANGNEEQAATLLQRLQEHAKIDQLSDAELDDRVNKGFVGWLTSR
jgi:predicted Zn-dependent protease